MWLLLPMLVQATGRPLRASPITPNVPADGDTYQGWQDAGSASAWQETVFDLTNVPG